MALPSYNTSIITAVGKTQQGVAFPKFIMGGKGGAGATSFKLFKKSSTYTFANWRSKKFLIGRPFNIVSLKIPLSIAIASNMTIVPVIYFDDDNSSATGTTINSTNYASSNKMIFLKQDNFSAALKGDKNFYLELQFTGSALVGVQFPITFQLELENTI